MYTIACTLAATTSALVLWGAAPLQDAQTPATTSGAPTASPTAPLPPGSRPTIEELIAARKNMSDLLKRAESSEVSDDDKATLRRQATDLSQWLDRSADPAPVIERIEVPKSVQQTGYEVVAGIQRMLTDDGARIRVNYNTDQRVVMIAGRQWEVTDAKEQIVRALRELEVRMQDDAADEARKNAELAAARAEEAERALKAATVELDWGGGTLEQLVALIQKQSACNVVFATPSTRLVDIPPFQIRLVTPEVLFQSLNILSANGTAPLMVEVVKETEKQSASDPIASKTKPVIVIRQRLRELRHALHDLGDCTLADEKGIASLIEAIDFAMQNAGSAELVSLRYHEPTKLLFVKAPADSIALVNEIVNTIRSRW